MRDKLNEVIENCQEGMEKNFLHLGEVYFELMDEINKKTYTAEKIISDYRNHLSKQDGQNINAMVHFLEDNVSSLNKSLNEIDTELDESINVLNNNLQQFHVVEDNITQIKESSELMELMALNSMVVAIKAGSKGGGFTYITEVLRKNASNTISLTDELQDLGQQLKNNLGELQNLLSSLNNQRNNVSNFENELNQSFATFHRAMESFIQFLNDLSSKSVLVRKDVLNITEKISHQDIYRQSLDHISLLIHDIPQTDPNDKEMLLDSYSYYNFLTDFSIPLLKDISSKLDNNIQTFETETTGVSQYLRDIEKNRTNYASKNKSDIKEDCCLFYHVEKVDQSLNSLVMSVQLFIKEIDKIAMINRSIMDRIKNLDERNQRFERIIKAFRNIIIMGRIEVTKNIALAGVEISVNDIAKITDNIEINVQSASDAIDIVVEMNKSIVEKITQLKYHITLFMSDFTSRLQEFSQISAQGKHIFQDTMDRLNFYPLSFDRYFKSAINATKDLKNIISQMDDLRQILENNQNDCEKNKKKILSELGLDNWEIKNENINKVLEKFTIYSQKTAAQALAGKRKEEGNAVEESSVVFF